MRSFRYITSCGLLIALSAGCAGDDAESERDVLADLDNASGVVTIDGGTLDAGEVSVDGGDVTDGGVTPLDGGLDGGTDAGLPNGAYFASVVANGTGCPAGTWITSISPDGQRFATTFTAFEVAIHSGSEDLAITKNCVIAIALHSPAGLTFSVKSARFDGYAFLEQGVTATFRARYWFQGSPIPNANSNRTTLVGPYDSDFIFKDDVRTQDAVWSPCGTERDLNVNATLQIQNSSPKRSGYAMIGSDGYSFSLELAWRSCTPPKAPPVVSKK
ncbi:MAG: DUF4360 domain-containing protein [Polyangiales bacterium]